MTGPTTMAPTTRLRAVTVRTAGVDAAAVARPPVATMTPARPDDPPNTVVHERQPRTEKAASKSSGDNEIQGIAGSTRLEAKRQRRRDGRDAGRRRPPILSEGRVPGQA